MYKPMALDQPKNESRWLFWREWVILVFAGVAVTLGSLPALWSVLEQTADKMGLSMPSFLALQMGSSVVQIAIFVAVGLFFARRTGLGAPILERWLKGEAVGDKIRSFLAPAISLGVLAAIAIFALERLVFAPLLPGFATVTTEVSGWQALLAAFYGGVLEELITRLLYVSVLAWLLGRLSHTPDGIPSQGAVWAAIVVAAVLFGLQHLPAASLSVTITPLVILRAIILNGIAGVLYGGMYYKRGLEAAMLTHFSSDILLHVILYPLFGTLLK
jgi:membrane protease YdiL (CAAX protease family)